MTAHRVWRVPADIDTDALAPGATMKFDIEVTAQHCLEGVRADFAQRVQQGDVIAAGPNFGIGSSREQAATVLVHLGVAAVIAPSFGGLFFRNAFNVGLLLLTCAEAQALQDGEDVAFDVTHGRITRADCTVLACDPIPDFLLEMARAGGLLAQLKQRFRKETP